MHDDGKNFVKLLDALNEGEESSAQKLRPGLSSLQYRANWM